MKKQPVLKTKRLLVRPMTDEQLSARIDAEPDAHMRQAYGEMLAGCRADPAHRLFHACWEIALRDGTSVGDLCFKGPPVNAAVEIGYGIDEAYRGAGYAGEAVSALLDWAFAQSDALYFVTAEVEPGNAASRRMLEKLEFAPDGVGVEGDRFRKERPVTSWISLGMCFGSSLGVSFGAAFDNLSLCLPLGICFGMLIGVLFDDSAKKKREAARAAYEAAKQPLEKQDVAP